MSALTLTSTRQALLERLERTAQEFTNVSRENADFLRLLTLSVGARTVLEVGTSNGYSTLFFAMAVEGRGGRVVSLELNPERASLARRHIEEAGLSDVIEVREGNALDSLAALKGEWDLVFLDAEKSEYRRYAEIVLPKLKAGGLLVADDTQSLRHAMTDFVEWAYSEPSVETCDLTIDDGVILCWKRTS